MTRLLSLMLLFDLGEKEMRTLLNCFVVLFLVGCGADPEGNGLDGNKPPRPGPDDVTVVDAMPTTQVDCGTTQTHDGGGNTPLDAGGTGNGGTETVVDGGTVTGGGFCYTITPSGSAEVVVACDAGPACVVDTEVYDCKLENSDIGVVGLTVHTNCFDLTVVSWESKLTEHNEYVGFTLSSPPVQPYTVKVGNVVYTSNAQIWTKPEGDTHAISYVNFCN